MTRRSDEIKNYNRMIRGLQGVEKFIAQTYLSAQEEIKDKIAAFRQRQETSQLGPGNALQLRRLETLNADIDEKLKDIFKAQNKAIKTGYINEWNQTYLNSAYDIEKSVQAFQNFDVSIGYHHINDGYIRSVFNAPIAGQTFLDRSLRDRLVLQFKVKSAVSQAVVEGLSVKDLAGRLKDIDEVFEVGKNKALLTAQQELTTAYSYGQRDAINTAIDNGVEGENRWSATLDGRTRTEHAREDGKKRNEETGLFTLADGTTIEMPRVVGAGTAGLNQIMRCRCRMLFLPFGIAPTKRMSKLEDGTWKEVNGDMDYTAWSKTIEGQKTIEEEVRYRKARAARLRKKREKAS